MKRFRKKGTNELFELDFDAMKKADYFIRSCRLPFVPDEGEVMLYQDGMEDNGESYLLVDEKFLIKVEVK